jgi:hypothetical protein
LFTLDSVHPSATAQAILANAFISVMNSAYGLTIPLITEGRLNRIAAADPHVDHDGDGVVPGRPFAGLLETIAPPLGLAGDRDQEAAVHPTMNPGEFLVAIKQLPSASQPGQTSFEAAREALRYAFGVQRFAPHAKKSPI